ncbi:MAG: outer membrane beta-barrel protein [Legionellales bacterium]|nr:outer membrane beta-barrel protein [Legionellales bacterium]
MFKSIRLRFFPVFFLLSLTYAGASVAAASTVSTVPAPSAVTLSVPSSDDNIFRPAYIGVLLGYGNTNWDQMVSQDASTATSTPISAGGSGVAEGITLGYAFTRYFTLEGDYTHFPDATLEFSSYSVYRPLTETTSKTNAYGLFGKFMLPLDNGKWSPFSEIGPGYVQRNDDLAQKGHFGGAFGVGIDYFMTSHWMTELSLQYYTGYGDSTLKPAYDYIPFLYTVNLRIAYRFSL